MTQRQLRTIALVLCSSYFVGDKIVHSADVDDRWRETLREGIEARQSAIHSLKLKYTVVSEVLPAGAVAAKKILQGQVSDGTISKQELKQILSHPLPGTEVTKVELLMSGGKVAAATVDATPNSDTAPIRFVFDGEILTLLEGREKGKRARGKLEDALPETTIESLCRLQGMALERLLELPRATSTLLPPAAESKDVVFRVTATSEPREDRRQQSEVVAEINATRSCWPRHLAESFLPNDPDSPGLRYTLREVWLSDFQTTGSIDFPGKIEEVVSACRNTTDESGVIDGIACEATGRTTLILDDIALNEPVDASEFVLNFPPGASYLDLDGATKIVQPDGTIQNFSAKVAARSLVAEDRRNERAWGIGAWQSVALGATTLLSAIVFVLYFLKPLRARGSA